MTRATHTGLSATGLACRRHERLLFDNLSFTVASGEMLQVCGPNGSGKSTLLRLLSGLRQPDAGEILWQGQALTTDPAAFRNQLCAIGHRSGLNGDLSPSENLRLEAALFGIDPASVEPSLEKLGLQLEQKLPSRLLSAGQRQRASLARLLMRKAGLWILDEPCASLDRNAQEQVQQIMLEQMRTGGCVVFTTHQPLPFAGEPVRQLMLGESA